MKMRTYNIWLGDNGNYKYLATVVAKTIESACSRMVSGCGLDLDKLDLADITDIKYHGVTVHPHGNPKFNS